MAPVLKTGVPKRHRGFESHPLRHPIFAADELARQSAGKLGVAGAGMGRTMTAASLGAMGVSAYGSSVNDALNRVTALDTQAKTLEVEFPAAAQLGAEAQDIRAHYRAIAAGKAGVEVASEFILPEETLLTKGLAGTSFLRRAAGATAKSFAEGAVAEAGGQTIDHAAYGDKFDPLQIARGGLLEAAAGAPMIAIGSLKGHPAANVADESPANAEDSLAGTLSEEAAQNAQSPPPAMPEEDGGAFRQKTETLAAKIEAASKLATSAPKDNTGNRFANANDPRLSQDLEPGNCPSMYPPICPPSATPTQTPAESSLPRHPPPVPRVRSEPISGPVHFPLKNSENFLSGLPDPLRSHTLLQECSDDEL